MTNQELINELAALGTPEAKDLQDALERYSLGSDLANDVHPAQLNPTQLGNLAVRGYDAQGRLIVS